MCANHVGNATVLVYIPAGNGKHEDLELHVGWIQLCLASVLQLFSDARGEAIQRLYSACRTKSGFPGKIPDESTGTITTTAILKN
jgi:hypothetical protein